MKNVACYVRVSTEEQKKHGLSVDSQIDALEKYCAENNYNIIDIYNDAGISARKRYTKRPALLRLLDDCQNGKIDLIIFTKLDRWFRSVGDYYEVQAILDKKKIPWRSIWEDYETETSSGVFKVNIMLSVAQSEADRTSERIKAVNEFKRAKGGYLGSAPTGYCMHGSDLIIDESVREAVTVYFKTYIETRNVVYSLTKAKEYGLNISKQTAQRMLKNPAYKGSAFGGYSCEPYLTPEQWDYIQSARQTVQKEYYEKEARVYYFTGVVCCAICGKGYHGTVRRMGKHQKAYKYYRCAGHQNLYCSNQRSINESVLEKYVVSHLDEELKKYTFEWKKNLQKPVDNRQKIANLENRLKRVGERYEDGDITREEYKSKRSAILEEIEKLNAERNENGTPVELPANWLEMYSQLDDLHKKFFWNAVFKRITIDEQGNIKMFF